MGAWGHDGEGGMETLLWIGNAQPHATEPAHAIGIARAKITAIVRSWHERRTYTCARLVWRIARRTSQGPETVQWADGFRTSPPCPHAPMPPSFQKSLTVDPYHQAPMARAADTCHGHRSERQTSFMSNGISQGGFLIDIE